MSLPVRSDNSTLATWDPFRELDEFRARMNHVLDTTLANLGSTAFRFEPPVDLEEIDDAFLVEADLPGVKRDDVEVELIDNQLVIRGECKERERVGILRRRTRKTGEFDYRLLLPGEVEADGVDAHLEDGVLHLRIPKAAASRRRRIEVKVR